MLSHLQVRAKGTRDRGKGQGKFSHLQGLEQGPVTSGKTVKMPPCGILTMWHFNCHSPIAVMVQYPKFVSILHALIG